MLRPGAARHEPVELRPLASSVGTDDEEDDNDERKSPTDKWLEYVLHKLHALLWVVLASAVAAYTNLFELIIDGTPPSDPSRQLNRFAFNIGLAGFGGWCVVAIYLIVYAKYIKKMPGDWEQIWPQGIPIATACAVASLLAFGAAFWPVWGGWTIPAIIVLFLGLLSLLSFAPF